MGRSSVSVPGGMYGDFHRVGGLYGRPVVCEVYHGCGEEQRGKAGCGQGFSIKAVHSGEAPIGRSREGILCPDGWLS